MVLMVIGILAIVGGFLTDHSDHHQRWWANLLINGFFFLAISLGALFFYALQYAAEVGWSAYIKRFFEAMFAFIPYGMGLIIVILLVGHVFHGHHLYHWMDSSLYAPYIMPDGTLVETMEAGAVENPNYDHIIAHKGAFFGAFFWIRTIAYLVVFVVFARLFRKWSLQEDKEGGIAIHYKMYKRSALFLVFFAVFSSTIAWDYLMSIDAHWFSTLFGWYVFSGMWVGAMIFALVSLLWLRSKGYYADLNQSHVHDLSKWMFAISMLWSYLWFSQFMLIWYSDIPEEVTYFKTRFDLYMVPYLTMFFINFAVPFYVMIARDAKRNIKFILPVALLIFVGHFVDVYLLVIPGTMHDHNVVGWMEVGMFLGFLGFFTFLTFNRLSKAPLIPVNHPYLQESKDLNY